MNLQTVTIPCKCPDGYPKTVELREQPDATSSVRWVKHTGACDRYDELQIDTGVLDWIPTDRRDGWITVWGGD